MKNLTNIPLSIIEKGIKESIKNAKVLLSISNVLMDNNYGLQSIVTYYYALAEFGKAVLLRDKMKIVEIKSLSEVDVSDFFYDNNKKIMAAVRTAGPHVEILKNHLFEEYKASHSGDNSDSCSFEYIDFMLVDFDQNGKWVLPSLPQTINSQKNAFLILEKMLKKWDAIY